MNAFVKGLLVGFAIAVATFLVVIVTGVLLVFHLSESEYSIVGTEAVEILSHRLEAVRGTPTVFGSLRNETGNEISRVLVQASLFDAGGAFIDKANEYIGHLPPHEEFGFKISFYDWEHAYPIADLHYKVRITQGFEEP